VSEKNYWNYWELIILFIAFKLIEFRNKHTNPNYVQFKVVITNDLDRVFEKIQCDIGIFTSNFIKEAFKIRLEITKEELNFAKQLYKEVKKIL